MLFIIEPLLYIYIKLKYKSIWNIKACLKEQKEGVFKKVAIRCYDKMLGRWGSWIGIDSSFEDIPCFPHGISGVFVSSGAKIGKKCVIFQQVTIGSNMLKGHKKAGSPTIGNNVYIGAGAKIIGNIMIGDNCRIGANAVIVNDMSPNTVAVQAPPRIIQKNEILDNRHFSFCNNNLCYYDNGKWVLDDIDEF